jgi:lipopolysaccharide biosynthesis glycosyltransferase
MRLVTMADDSYAPGLAVLVHSLVNNSRLARPQMTVIMRKPINHEYRRALGDLGCELEFVDLGDVGAVRPRPGMRRVRQATLQKVLVFNLPWSETSVFLDSDMVCLRDVTDIEALPAFAAAPHRGWDLARLPDGRPVFNSGLFTFVPDADLSAEIADFYATSSEPFELGDQMVLNRFFAEVRPGAMTLLEEDWNTLTWAVVKHRNMSLDGVRFLHFVGYNPWQNMWFAYDECGSEIVDLYDLWWDQFVKTGLSHMMPSHRPRRWAVRASHSYIAKPAWRLAHRAWFAYRGARTWSADRTGSAEAAVRLRT